MNKMLAEQNKARDGLQVDLSTEKKASQQLQLSLTEAKSKLEATQK